MIYEDDEKFEKSSHISYKEYKKQLETNPNEGLILFVSAFFVMLLLFLGVVKQLSPDVDVTISDNSETSTEELTRGSVDNRLKMIQMEDNSFSADDDTFSPELEEKVRLPKAKNRTIGEQEAEVIVLEKQEPVVEELQEAVSATPVSAKVIVGYYATSAQAEVAKSIIQDAGLDIQPFVKNIGAAYTLQVGSFTSREKAQSVANDLLKNNFPARVIIE